MEPIKYKQVFASFFFLMRTFIPGYDTKLLFLARLFTCWFEPNFSYFETVWFQFWQMFRVTN
jgi:hypothetical protein